MSDKEEKSSQSADSQTEDVAGSFAQRRSGWRSSIDAIAYICKLAKRPEATIRQSDRVTAISLLLAIVATILCLLLHKLSGLSLQVMTLCDFFLGVSLIIYVGNRLGILTALPPRQAVLTWQLMQAFTYVGVFITVNIAIVLTVLLSSISWSRVYLP